MDFKRNELFFNHKRTRFWMGLSYTSYVFFALAVVVFISAWGWLAAALPFATIGVAILLTALSMITSEKQIKEQIVLLQNGARDAALEHFGYPNQNPELFFEFEGYDLIDPDLPLRKRRSGRVFSTVYVITYLMIENNTLRIWQKKSSLVEDKEEIIKKDIPFSELSHAETLVTTVQRTCIDGKTRDIPTIALLVKGKGGDTITYANCKIADYDMDRFAENLAHLIARSKENTAK